MLIHLCIYRYLDYVESVHKYVDQFFYHIGLCNAFLCNPALDVSHTRTFNRHLTFLLTHTESGTLGLRCKLCMATDVNQRDIRFDKLGVFGSPITIALHIEIETKWPALCRQHFQVQ